MDSFTEQPFKQGDKATDLFDFLTLVEATA
jgi:hypothetical protein